MLTHVGLFEGSGIPSLCAKMSGFRTIAQCENDPCCLYALKNMWPNILHYGDVKTADWNAIKERVTLLTAGVPCQPVSVAGKQLGEKDERWLWPDTIRAVRSLRPAWLLFENPPAIILHGLERIVAELESIGYEFIPKGDDGNFTPLRIGAWAVGATHKRDRVWIVAYAAEVGRARQGDNERGYVDKSSTAMADTHKTRREECVCIGSNDGTQFPPTIGSRWPARPGEQQHDWEAPRLVEFSVGNATDGLAGRVHSRANKQLLRMAGNGWTFPVALMFLQWIAEQIRLEAIA